VRDRATLVGRFFFVRCGGSKSKINFIVRAVWNLSFCCSLCFVIQPPFFDNYLSLADMGYERVINHYLMENKHMD